MLQLLMHGSKNHTEGSGTATFVEVRDYTVWG